MVKLTGKKKIPIAVFISGRGSNLKSIYQFSKNKNSFINLKLIISDKLLVKGVLFAKKNKIKTKIINYENKNIAEKQIINFLSKNNIKLICLAGFMKILSKKFVNRYKNKIINIHPSLLPKYKGLNTHERVIKMREKYSGCTIHFVTEKIDSGKIIMQKKVRLKKSDTPKSLARKVLKLENELYPVAISKVISMI
tara:strand:- start:993 stop:1577 length:585 start_codon:yes stop_codon:yes gene_type:complete